MALRRRQIAKFAAGTLLIGYVYYTLYILLAPGMLSSDSKLYGIVFPREPYWFLALPALFLITVISVVGVVMGWHLMHPDPADLLSDSCTIAGHANRPNLKDDMRTASIQHATQLVSSVAPASPATSSTQAMETHSLEAPLDYSDNDSAQAVSPATASRRRRSKR